jgi:DNA-directed RNA polymerase specialized sigma subunit
VRTELYVTTIGPVLNELVDKIVFTFKFNNLPNIEDLKDECKVWLTTILDKFDPNKGSAAFSYFSVITKNWFIHKVKKTAQQNKREVSYEDAQKEESLPILTTENPYHDVRTNHELIQEFFVEVEEWKKMDLKPNEKLVLDAICLLFQNAEDIDIFNKKAIYLYIREITGLNTKQIVNSLAKIRNNYRLFRKRWDNDDI